MENLGILDSLSDDCIDEILQSWNGYCSCTEEILKGKGDLSIESEFVAVVIALCRHGLDGLVKDHFFQVLEVDCSFPLVCFPCLLQFDCCVVCARGVFF